MHCYDSFEVRSLGIGALIKGLDVLTEQAKWIGRVKDKNGRPYAVFAQDMDNEGNTSPIQFLTDCLHPSAHDSCEQRHGDELENAALKHYSHPTIAYLHAPSLIAKIQEALAEAQANPRLKAGADLGGMALANFTRTLVDQDIYSQEEFDHLVARESIRLGWSHPKDGYPMRECYSAEQAQRLAGLLKAEEFGDAEIIGTAVRITPEINQKISYFCEDHVTPREERLRDLVKPSFSGKGEPSR